MSLQSGRRSLRVVLYEPSGRGGVCHYTHELGEHLALAGIDVALITTEDYELEHLERHFRIKYLFGPSWFTRLQQALASFRNGTRSLAEPSRRGERPPDRPTAGRASSGRR